MQAIDIRNLVFSYQPDTSSPDLFVPNWQLALGQRCFLHGPSGSGKSTLLRLLCGLMPPQSGEIRLLGQSLGELKPTQMDRFRARHIGLVSQQLHLLPYLSVAENIELAFQLAKPQGVSTEHLNVRITELMSALQLPDTLRDRPARMLSLGQQQRVAIARALINQPALVLVDEPTSALDYQAADAFMQLLLESLSPDTSVLMISHDQRHAPLFDVQVSMAELQSTSAPTNASTNAPTNTLIKSSDSSSDSAFNQQEAR